VRVIAIEGCASLWKREVGRDFTKIDVDIIMRPLITQ
jgi:hypothetical protein